jgi:hypothetical protein
MREAVVPEFEVRIFRTGQTSGDEDFETILIDASNEKAALPEAAQLAKKHGADFFEVRRPVSQRWVRRD